MDNRATMKNKLIDYFMSGCKKKSEYLGMELEMFLVEEENLRSYKYDEAKGQEEFLNKLRKKGWELLLEEEGHPLGLKKNGTTITLEPGGQVEISLKPYKDIQDIEKACRQVLDEMKSVLEKGQCFVAVGYHPKTRIEDLPLLPKERYHHMFEYFRTHGEKSHYMMKGTAATQLSIDYTNEEDFIKKYRVANFIGPILSKIFDASPIFQGQVVEGHNLRIDIWNHTDPVRSKYPKGGFTSKFDFDAYAEYLMETPPIFTKVGESYEFTGEKALDEICSLYPVDKIDVSHIAGMVFPDVRLKKYIEIRMADALPLPYVFALPAIIKGIFYSEDNVNRYYEFAKKYDESDAKAINEKLLSELDFTHKDISTNWFMMKVMLDAKSALSPEESKYIDGLFEQVNKEGSYSNKLKRLYKEGKDNFLEEIRL